RRPQTGERTWSVSPCWSVPVRARPCVRVTLQYTRGMAGPYHVEEFTDSERNLLSRFFTNLDSPVFAIVNLPEVVKGALFARYSRSPKSLRRLFLDEFIASGPLSAPAPSLDTTRAEQLYERVFFEYGDDSVAQLGGVHL